MNKQLLYFVLTAEKKSLNMAASQLFITPPALLRQINALEYEVGAKLLNRDKKGVSLTPAGECFYEGAKQIIKLTDKIVDQTREAAGISESKIVIGSWSCAYYNVLPAISNYFNAKHPNIELQFKNIAGLTTMHDLLESREIDLTFAFGFAGYVRPGFRYIPIFYEEPICYIPLDCNLVTKSTISIADFREMDIVVIKKGLSPWHDRIQDYLHDAEPSIRFHDVKENESGLLYIKKLNAPSITGRSTVMPEKGFKMVPLSKSDFQDFSKISFDIVCRDEKNAVIEQFINDAFIAAKHINLN